MCNEDPVAVTLAVLGLLHTMKQEILLGAYSKRYGPITVFVKMQREPSPPRLGKFSYLQLDQTDLKIAQK